MRTTVSRQRRAHTLAVVNRRLCAGVLLAVCGILFAMWAVNGGYPVRGFFALACALAVLSALRPTYLTRQALLADRRRKLEAALIAATRQHRGDRERNASTHAST
jgi:hypothetical protein